VGWWDWLVALWETGEGIRALMIVTGGLVAGFLTTLLFRRVILRLVRNTETELDDFVALHLRLPVAATVVVVSLWYASTMLHLVPPTPRVLKGVLGSTAVIVWGVGLAGVTSDLLSWLVTNQERLHTAVNARTLPAFDIGMKFVVYGGGAYFLFLAWEIDPTAWLASAGIAGLAFGFAAQQTLSNVIAGVSILAEGPYKLGDYLRLDSGEQGRVTEIGMRSTRLLTNDDMEVIIPNSLMASSRIINHSGGPATRARLHVEAGVAYGSDIDAVRALLLDVASNDPNVLGVPPPQVRLVNFGDSAVEFSVLFWIARPRLHLDAEDSVRSEIYRRFAAEGVEFPFPQRDVHVIERGTKRP
jgi:MscS family membrane protein